MTLKEKQQKVKELSLKQIKLLNKCVEISNRKPGKRPSTAMKRIGKIIGLSMQVRMLQLQIHTVLSQTYKSKFKSGCVSNKFGEVMLVNSNNECIDIVNSTTTKPPKYD